MTLWPCVRWPPWSRRERHQRVARLHHRGVDGHVRLRARVRLDVRVLGAEQLLRPVDRELLDLVDHLAAAVVAASRIALGVLVRRHGADRLEHGGPREVLGRDQLDLPALALELRRRGAARSRDRSRRAPRASAPGTSPASWPRVGCYSGRGPAPCPRRTRGSPPVRSITVDGTPGSSPASTIAPQAARISSGMSSTRRGSGPPERFALVAATTPTARTTACAPGGRFGTRTPTSRRRACTAPGGTPEHRRVEPRHRGDERVDVGGEQRDRLRAVAAP